MLSTFGLRPDSSGYNFKQSMGILVTARAFVKKFRPPTRESSEAAASSEVSEQAGEGGQGEDAEPVNPDGAPIETATD